MAVFDRVSRAVVVVDGAGKFEEVTDGVGEEKIAVFSQISLVESIFKFFLYSVSVEDCDVAMRVGGLILKCRNDETGCVESILGGFGIREGAGGENGCGDVAVTCISSPS